MVFSFFLTQLSVFSERKREGKEDWKAVKGEKERKGKENKPFLLLFHQSLVLEISTFLIFLVIA